MIPKIIHYCWFGGKEKPKDVLNCIESWKKNNPDFMIKEWNENTFDVYSIPFTREAYSVKKYAFVADVVRLFALTTEGGIYLDTDVEVLQSFTDNLLNRKFFIGFEKTKQLMVGTAVIGSTPNNKIFKQFYALYKQRNFIKENGMLDTTPNVNILTEILQKEGLIISNTIQHIHGGTIYPCEYFSPKNLSTRKIKVTANTFSIHHFAGTWIPKWKKLILLVWIPFCHLFPRISSEIKKHLCI